MTDRPEELRRRLAGLDSIGQVVGALRAIASGQAASARGAMAAISAYSGTVREALIAAAAGPPPEVPGPGLVLVVGAAQGFSGAYPARIAEAARALAAPGAGFLVVGARTLAMLGEAGPAVLWSADLPGHPAAIPELASRVTDAMIGAAPRHPGPIRALVGPARAGDAPETRAIFPPAPETGSRPPPLTTLPPARLLAGLLEEALFAQVALALMRGVEAEARARVEAMARARSNLRARRAEVERDFRQARQEQMTTEMIELTSARPDED
ncbi:F0F1 ATP synthase subunit gamma [Amaricoccus solimangrovi]|uniref:F0F1 ATP synthase subunit gamma n=1 Tax=Amaricoccus solimangrovi TaxID=2589815 RepID=A0A501WVY5_9RHOB|nr:F0F1 ATP synthase subunit gamma [Amaricoccus solimangrovi]TPE53913.1 F0F1 ATP synthase subunit gamma [Amaricoccus solimangrovi]